MNLPLQPGSGDDVFLAAFDRVCDRVGDFGPSTLVAPLGIDAGDSDTESPLAVANSGLGAVGAPLRALGHPTVLVQEGGYDLTAPGPDVMAVLATFR